MSLIDEFMEPFKTVTKTQVSDGEGGLTTVWTEGAQFDAAATQDTTMQARIAEKEGVTSTWTITTKKTVLLDYHDVIKRVSDGAIFRITSYAKDKKSPAVSSLNMAQASAEKWELPT